MTPFTCIYVACVPPVEIGRAAGDATARQLDVAVRVSHQGPGPIQDAVEWGWEGAPARERIPVVIGSYALAAPPAVRRALPDGATHGRLSVRLVDDAGCSRASGVFGVALAP